MERRGRGRAHSLFSRARFFFALFVVLLLGLFHGLFVLWLSLIVFSQDSRFSQDLCTNVQPTTSRAPK
jgi:hypothetical protein